VRPAPLILSLAAFSWAGVAAVLGSGTLSQSRPPVPASGPSPACLPRTVDDSSAGITGTPLNVAPAPNSVAASPATQVSFLGAPVTALSAVRAVGSRSGRHGGTLSGFSQGDGASFAPYRPFQPDETVTVNASLQTGGSMRSVAFRFHTTTPSSTAGIPGFPNPPAAAADYQTFHSIPELHPPALSVTAPDRDPGAGLVFLTPASGPGRYGPTIVDGSGRLVWFDQLPPGQGAENLSIQRYQGHPVLTWWQGRVLSLGFGEGEDVIMDSNYQTQAVVRAGNGYRADLHEFQLTPQGTAYLTAYAPVRCDLTSRGGLRNGVLMDTVIQEVDLNTGLVRFEWHSLDHVGVDESHVPVPSATTPWDYFHLNSIDLQHDGSLLLSARSTWATYEVAPGSGSVRWRLGGTRSTFTMGPDTQTAWQHDARRQADGTISLYDDGASPRVHYQSRGIVVALDMARRTARLVRAYQHPTPLVADSQGNMQMLPGGQVLIGWGSVPYVSEFTRSGALLFDAHLPPGTGFYRAFRFPWHGQPLAPPMVSGAVIAGDQTAVYASWNGATDVASWRVLAGQSTDALAAVATIARSGFETTELVPNAYRFVAVQAIDGSGRLLATSATVPVAQVAPR
jgi:hypothetical protein